MMESTPGDDRPMLDAPLIIGSSLTGLLGHAQIHAVISGPVPEVNKMYCNPSKTVAGANLGSAQGITCELCKAKLKRELTNA